jgi:P27 family predicted phage terminase small subunit
MGKRGPQPQPSELQRAKGTYRADRRRGEVRPDKTIPPIPEWCDEKTRECWEQLAPWLNEQGLLTRLDQVALGLLCSSLADYILARRIVDGAEQREGTRFVAYTDKGNIIQHPAVGVMNKAWEKVVKLCREFGMTPAARAGLAIAKNEAAEDPMTALLEKLTQRRMQPPPN